MTIPKTLSGKTDATEKLDRKSDQNGHPITNVCH